MNKFLVLNQNDLIYLLVFFLLGLIFGAGAFNLYISREMDRLQLKNRELQNQVQEQEKEITRLEDNLSRYTGRFIKNIGIKLDTDLNEHRQQLIETRVRELLSEIPGNKIRDIEPPVIGEIVNERLVEIENDTYRLDLDYLILGEELILYLSAELKE
ncbi:MAG: hypothetical protein ACOCQC_03470 [Halanaerobiaceae bacterium]